MADRADQEAARRRYLCNSQRTAYPNLAGPAANGFDAGWDAAMAAADERERNLQRWLDNLHADYKTANRTRAEAEVQVRTLTEALREKQEAVDFAAQALRSSEYVGGPSQREAWHLATVALFDAETERKATNPDALPVESEPEEGWCERCKGKATLTRTVIGAAPTMRLCSDCVAEPDGRTDA